MLAIAATHQTMTSLLSKLSNYTDSDCDDNVSSTSLICSPISVFYCRMANIGSVH